VSTIKDVAKMANVSITTVSRYLNEFPNIRDDTRTRIAEAIRTLNYRTNVAARGLVTKTTKTIGVIALTRVDDFFENPFFVYALKGICRIAVSEDYDVLLSTTATEEDHSLDKWIHGQRVDGIILMKSRRIDPAVETLVQEKFPAVLLGRPEFGQRVSFVDNDNIRAAFDVTDHLLKLGHRKIAFIGGQENLVVTEDRLTGYRTALESGNVSLSEDYVCVGRYETQTGYNRCSVLLNLIDPPTAIVASDDVIAVGVLQAVHDLGKTVPRDLSVVGFNDIPSSEFTIPPLTTVRVNMEELGATAAQLLFQRLIEPERPPRHIIVDTQIVIRNSTGRLMD